MKKTTSARRFRLDVRMSCEAKARIVAAAAAAGKSVNVYATEWLLGQADDVINRNEMKAKK